MSLAINEKTSEVELWTKYSDFKNYGISRNFKFVTKIKKDKKKTREIIGYASTADKDRVDDVITLGALKKAKNDLLKRGSQTVFYNHNKNVPIGRVTKTEIDSKGLVVHIEISHAKDVEDIWVKIQEGVLNSLSIGGRFKKVRIERDDEGNVISFKVLEIELMEVSVVGLPANPKASIFSAVEKTFKGFLERGIEMGKEAAKKEAIKKEDGKKNEGVGESKKEAEKKTDELYITKADFEDAMKTVTEGFSELTKMVKEVKANKEEQKKEDPKKEDSKKDIPSWVADLKAEIKEVKEELHKEPSRKGIMEEEESEDELDIKKLLKDPEGLESQKFAKYAMDNKEEVYDKLEPNEKKIVDAIYMKMVMNNKKK